MSVADKYGVPEAVWLQTRAEMRAILVACARERRVLPYGQLAAQVTGIQFEAHDQRMFDMLGEISQEEDAFGRGMLTARLPKDQGTFSRLVRNSWWSCGVAQR